VSVDTLAVPAVILIFLSASTLLVSRDWRVSIAALALQYLGITVLIALTWSLDEAAVKLVTGWMAGAVLGLAMIGLPGEAQAPEKLPVSYLIFRALLAVLAGLVAYSIGERLVGWFADIAVTQAIGSLFLILVGLLHLGLTTQPLRVTLGLLTVLGGFEILYAALERSILVAGLLAAITLGLATVGAYLMAVPSLEESEQ
jgi:hypothetical protein